MARLFGYLKVNFMKLIRIISAFVLISVILLFSSCTPAEKEETVTGVQFPVTVMNDIVIEDMYSYSGEFPEDGSFAEKENVVALKVRNESEKPLQFLRIYVTTDLKEMVFEISTLPSGMAVIVFEKSGQSLGKNEKITDIKGYARADFENQIGLMRETFEIDVHDKIINIKNISGADIDSDIYLYYKKKDKDGNYFGGITFRTKADGLKAGELKQLPASHFDLSDSEVIFIDYADN